MSIRHRVKRLAEAAAGNSARPLTVVLLESGPGKPPGRRQTHDGLSVEIIYDPADGPSPLPPGGAHKLVIGANIYDLV